MHSIILGSLLVLPVMAVLRSGMDLRWLSGYFFFINILSYGMYAVDKRRAKSGKWRIPESQLHLADLLGGWPAGYIAQRRLRHKCSKRSYLLVYWLTVAAWQLCCLEWITGIVVRVISG